MLTEGDVLQIGGLEPNTLEAVLTYPEHWPFAIVLTSHNIGVGNSRTISRWGLVNSGPYIEGWEITGPCVGLCWFFLSLGAYTLMHVCNLVHVCERVFACL